MALNQRRVRVTIDTKGGHMLEALEGFAGENCMAQTRDLEVAIGGLAVEEGKTDAYYDSDDSNPVGINLD